MTIGNRDKTNGTMRSAWIAMALITVTTLGAGAAARAAHLGGSIGHRAAHLGGSIGQICKQKTRGLVRVCNRLVEKRAAPVEGDDSQQMLRCEGSHKERDDNDTEREPLDSLFRDVFDLVDESVARIHDDDIDYRLKRVIEAAGLTGVDDPELPVNTSGPAHDRPRRWDPRMPVASVELQHVRRLNDLIRRIDDLTETMEKVVKAQAEVRDDRRGAEHMLALAQDRLADADARLAEAMAEEAKSAKIKAGMQRFVDQEVDRAHKVVVDARENAVRIITQAEQAAAKTIDRANQEAAVLHDRAGQEAAVLLDRLVTEQHAAATRALFGRWLSHPPDLQERWLTRAAPNDDCGVFAAYTRVAAAATSSEFTILVPNYDELAARLINSWCGPAALPGPWSAIGSNQIKR